jgi:hypothetical protein
MDFPTFALPSHDPNDWFVFVKANPYTELAGIYHNPEGARNAATWLRRNRANRPVRVVAARTLTGSMSATVGLTKP